MDNQNKQQGNQSEIAQFLARWDAEVDAMQQGLHGYAVAARHDIIIHRMQAFADDKMIELMTLAAKKETLNISSSSDSPM